MSLNADSVNARYDLWHPDATVLERARDIAGRCTVAQELWREVSKEEQERYTKEGQETLQKEQQEYQQLQDTLANKADTTKESQYR